MFQKILVAAMLCACFASMGSADEVPLGGFIPFVGIGLTDEFESQDDDLQFFVADPQTTQVGTPLGSGFHDIALLDSGAAVHIITQSAASNSGFDVAAEGFGGINQQEIFGATGGSIFMTIDDPLGIYAAGLGDRVSAGASLEMDPNDFRGQSSVSILEAGSDWELPNIVGLPLVAQHGVKILNSQPQIFQHQGRTMRTPQVEFFDLGQGDQQGINRYTNLNLEPSDSFLQGPFYVFDIANVLAGEPLHENPSTPTVIANGGLFLEVDVENNGTSTQNIEFLFDTGADVTVVSEFTALDMGIDVGLDEPDFLVEVEGAGGVAGGVPGYYVEEMEIDAVGGSLTLENVPVVVLNVPDPISPANIIDAIIGMHVFAGRDIVIDAAPAATVPSSNGPALYISDPVTEKHQWSTTSAIGNWATGVNWTTPGSPGSLWIAEARNVSGSDQNATVVINSTIFQLAVSGDPGARMTVEVTAGATLTTFGETLIEADGEVWLNNGTLDSQVVNIEGGTLAGNGTIFVGTGPISGVVRNLGGRIEPDGLLTVTGDLSNLEDATIAIDLFDGGNDLIDVSRNIFLDGTLEVSLDPNFTPIVGQQFTLFTFGDFASLDFANTILPLGFNWNLFIDGVTDSIILEAASIATIPGDFDANGFVDHQDLATWEAGYGPGGYTGLDFLVWQQNLGAGTPPTLATAVPEPTTLLILLSTALSCCGRIRKK